MNDTEESETLFESHLGVNAIKNGNEQCTAQFVPKGYSLKPGIDNNETVSSPV